MTDAIDTYEDEQDPAVKGPWEITTLGSADWALERLSQCEAEAEEIDAQLAAAISRLTARAEELKAKPARGAGFFRFKLLEFAERNRSTLIPGSKKTREFLHGKIAWRTKPERLEVTDKPALVEWLSRQPVESGLYRVTIAPEMKAIQEAFRSTGEIPPGCDLAPESESITVEATAPVEALTKKE